MSNQHQPKSDYEKVLRNALAEIYGAYDRLMSAPAADRVYELWLIIDSQRLITGNPNAPKPVGLLGRSAIATMKEAIAILENRAKTGTDGASVDSGALEAQFKAHSEKEREL